MLQDIVDGAQRVNKGSRSGIKTFCYSTHIGDPLNDAVNGMEIIQLMQKVGNMSQNWRLVNYGKLFDKFGDPYGIDYKTLQNEPKYEH